MSHSPAINYQIEGHLSRTVEGDAPGAIVYRYFQQDTGTGERFVLEVDGHQIGLGDTFAEAKLALRIWRDRRRGSAAAAPATVTTRGGSS